MKKYPESDWSILKYKLIPKCQDRYLAKRNQEILELLTEEGKTPTEKFRNAKRFRNAKGKMDREEKIINRTINNVYRSIRVREDVLTLFDAGIIKVEMFSGWVRDFVK